MYFFNVIGDTSPCGPTDKASDYESGDSGFESQQGCLFFLPLEIFKSKNKKRPPPAGFEPATPGLEVRCAIQLRHGGERPWWDSNPQPLDPKSSALSIAPQGPYTFTGPE